MSDPVANAASPHCSLHYESRTSACAVDERSCGGEVVLKLAHRRHGADGGLCRLAGLRGRASREAISAGGVAAGGVCRARQGLCRGHRVDCSRRVCALGVLLSLLRQGLCRQHRVCPARARGVRLRRGGRCTVRQCKHRPRCGDRVRRPCRTWTASEERNNQLRDVRRLCVGTSLWRQLSVFSLLLANSKAFPGLAQQESLPCFVRKQQTINKEGRRRKNMRKEQVPHPPLHEPSYLDYLQPRLRKTLRPQRPPSAQPPPSPQPPASPWPRPGPACAAAPASHAPGNGASQ